MLLKTGNDSFQKMVRSAGVEPATTRFVVWYSIQLSYDRTKIDKALGLKAFKFKIKLSLESYRIFWQCETP